MTKTERKNMKLDLAKNRGWTPVTWTPEDGYVAVPDHRDPKAPYVWKVRCKCGHVLKWNQTGWQLRHQDTCTLRAE